MKRLASCNPFRWLGVCLAALVPTSAIDGMSQAAGYPPTHFPDASGWGRNIQRTMRLLATSTPEHRNTVRILFYGQSITEQRWARLVEDDLRQRFPHANLIVENRALGGFASQMLAKTAETDLYPFQPDLLIFHVYGAHNSYEDIIRRTRERTTAEILMQNDHVTKPEDFTEETDPAKLPPAGQHWDAFMNHNWLPSVAKKYGAELCDQRGLWKAYLKENNLEPKALLKDAVHLNEHGEWFMAECVKACLRYDPRLGPSPAEDWVKTFEIGKDVRWTEGKLRLEFEGNRIEVVCRPGAAPPAAVRIDGRKPSEFSEPYGFTRAIAKPSGKWPVKWPVIAPIGSEKPLLVEDWTLSAKRVDAANDKLLSFTLTGSKTGSDGEGRSDARFVSKSGRVVIETSAWNVAYALSLGGIKPVPDAFEVNWQVEPRFVDEFASPGVTNTATEALVTLASGLPNGKHTLEISGGETTPIAAIRAYRPPLVDRPAGQSVQTSISAQPPYPVPPGLTPCTNLSLTLDGQPVWVESLRHDCPPNAPDWFRNNAPTNLSAFVAAFPCKDRASLKLCLQAPATSITVRPKSRQIPVHGGGRDWFIDIPGPGNFLVEVDSLPPLLVFADLPESRPDTNGVKTLVFGPGVHETGLMNLEDNAQVYLAQGAIVYGGFRGSPKNSRIYGRGILDGSRLKERMVHFNAASNLVVEGITMRCGNGWQNTLENCDHITYRNVKVLSFVPSGDGINPVNSRNVLIEDCFFRCSDDCVAIKAPRKGANVSGITIQNCILAGYCLSDGVTVGYELVTDTMENIIVRDCDILCARGGTRAGKHSAFSIICDGSATVRNVVFENIRVEENVPQLFELNVTHAQHYTRTSPGRIQNVRLRNIRWQTALPILLLGHNDDHLVEDVLFENCHIAGQSLTVGHLRTNAFTRAIRIQP